MKRGIPLGLTILSVVIRASAADGAPAPVEVRVRQTPAGPQVFVDGQAVRPRFYFGSPANLCNMAWTWETQFNVPFRAEEDTESGCVELPLYDGEKPIDFYDADLIDLVSGAHNTGVADTHGFGGIDYYGVPNAMTCDGPAGMRVWGGKGVVATAWPCATLLACT